MLSGNGVEDKVETADMLAHLLHIVGNNNLVGAKAKSIILLVRRSGKDNDVGSKGMSKLHCHVAQSAKTNNADLFALRNPPAAHGRVCCDPCAEERRGSGGIEVGREA